MGEGAPYALNFAVGTYNKFPSFIFRGYLDDLSEMFGRFFRIKRVQIVDFSAVVKKQHSVGLSRIIMEFLVVRCA